MRRQYEDFWADAPQDPEPWAWQRMGKLFRHDTNAALDIRPTDIEKLSTDVAPIAALTSVAPFSLSDAQIAALKKYVDDGGVLIIDPCGGAPAAAQTRPAPTARTPRRSPPMRPDLAPMVPR